MIVGIDARPFSYRLTGIGFYLKHLLDELQGLDTGNQYYLISNATIDYEIRNPKWCKIEGGFRTKLASPFWAQLVAPLIALEKGIDLFWGPRHQLPIFLPQRVKTVLTVHDIVHRLYPKTMALPNLLSERLFFRLSLSRSDAIVVDSESTASDIRRLHRVNAKKINTIHPGIPWLPGKAAHGASPNLCLPPRYFLFVGTLDPRKNLERLLDAYRTLGPEKHGVHLVIVGDEGWKNQSVRKRIKAEKLNGHIRLTGYVPREDLESLYRKALCLIFPSLYEGFGFPILEAMACGTPVITSNTSSMPEVAGNAALLVDPHDVSALVAAMNKIVKNEDLRKDLSAMGVERARHFSWGRCAEETLKVFEKVMKR
jgi:glycosyltransferase involved in cell wall biosynthesis